MPETPEPIGTKEKFKNSKSNFFRDFFFFSNFFFKNFFFLLKMDLEPSTKASGCLKNHKFLIFDGKQHPENFWFRGC